jgi:hypothetical protein
MVLLIMCVDKHEYYFKHGLLVLSCLKYTVSETGPIFFITCKGPKAATEMGSLRRAGLSHWTIKNHSAEHFILFCDLTSQCPASLSVNNSS